MDIAITLPQDLWKKIVSGEKTIELRKNFPKNFNVYTDKIYVIIKGTKKVGGFFYVRYFELFQTTSLLDFVPIRHKISVPLQWISNYVGHSPSVYLWHILDVHAYHDLFDRCILGVFKNNPQSFIYLR